MTIPITIAQRRNRKEDHPKSEVSLIFTVNSKRSVGLYSKTQFRK